MSKNFRRFGGAILRDGSKQYLTKKNYLNYGEKKLEMSQKM
jgi:hypothetical protein